MGHSNRTDGPAFTKHRHEDSAADTAATVGVADPPRCVRIVLDVRDIEHGAVEDTLEMIRLTKGTRELATVCLDGFGTEMVPGHKVGHLALEPIDGRGFGAAEAARTLHDRVEHRLHISGRATDHL